MSAVDVQGLISLRKKMQRAENERRVRLSHDIKGSYKVENPSAVRCYTYRGVSYCR